MTAQSEPLVIILSEDLLFSIRLQDTIRGMGYRCQLVETPSDLAAEGSREDRPIPLTEPLTGADAGFMRSLADLQPALMLVDLTAQELPWHRWIQIIKTSAASRQIPVLAFGPHIATTSFEQAKQAGADRVVPRGQMAKKLSELVGKYARHIDKDVIQNTCQQPLSDKARRGIKLHNSGQYFDAHEFLEEAWLAEKGEAGFLYRALLQVTVTYLHIERGNQRGAIKMLLRMRQWLDPLPDRCRGVSIAEMRPRMAALRQALLKLEPDSLHQLDRSLLGPIPLAPEPD